jgi:diaminohydroxyphosphoribosylaminopyrimidine deaminase/5-amino-6-(5-phosphoribosylamino)uracil reductase
MTGEGLRGKARVHSLDFEKGYIKRCIGLARRGEGRVEPNPYVGAVLAKGRKVIAEGYHRYFGGPHAEVYVFKKAGGDAKGSTLYLNLEPCCITGKTPPCTDLIIKSRVRKVVYSINDPNPDVNGKGALQLRKAGIQVVSGIMEEEARFLNRAFIKLQKTSLPYVILKWAMSLDGKIATKSGDSKWITSKGARARARGIRRGVQAVAVGINTVLKDDPMLIFSEKSSINPARIIFDSHARLPSDSKIVKTAKRFRTVVVVSPRAARGRVENLRKCGCKILFFEKSGLRDCFYEFGRMGFLKILVEGGGRLIASLLKGGLADEVFVFISPKVVGGAGAITPVEGEGVDKVIQAIQVKNVKIMQIGQEVQVHGFINLSWRF